MARMFGKSKAKAALALANPSNATLPADAEARFQALEAVDHWHTNLTQLDKIRGYNSFSFFADGRGLSIVEKSTDYTLTTADSGVICDTSGGNITITLPDPTTCFDGVNLATIIYDIHKLDNSTNTVTIVPNGAETISSEAYLVLSRQDETVQIATNGVNWLVRNRDRIYKGSTQTYKKDSVLIADTVVANTTTETTLFSTVFQADEMRQSDMIEIDISGVYSTGNASDSFTVRVKANGVTKHSFVSIAKNVTDTPVELKYKLTIRGNGVSAATSGMATFTALNDSLFGADVNDGTIDTTIANTINITMQWDSANINNAGTIKQGICRING